ncbi:hypothetical protein [Lacrimispora indolis]|uniref:hypothetical protein n=1 Tax=Lacrimispora indolis TaxID=69825 RepID=UPI00045E6C9A|nr:hypothetical protein [Lacrimispora indolis]MBE7721519.1 hypothetical protein [Lacrimispora celerecrescens]
MIIQKINVSSRQVAITSQQLTAASSQSSRTAEEVSKTIQEIAGRALEQSEHTMEGTAKIGLPKGFPAIKQYGKRYV